MSTIKDLQPKAVWENFYGLTQVPRPSYHEEKAREHVLAWAKNHHIEARLDESGNIIMSKPATPGMENRKGIILQGHLDMVPQKNEDKKHDFTKDPITAIVDGEWVHADGTTLGADNGIGVSTAMAVLTATDIPHGPIEVLVTATEETGMDGANGLKPGMLKGDILLNLDSETEGELYVGCAGGLDTTVEFNYKKAEVPAGCKAVKLGLKGLRGGHSGMDINLGRGNSNKLLFRFLKSHAENLSMRLASVSGGTLRNAIPRETFAVVVLPAANVEKLRAAAKEAEAVYKAEICEKDPDLTMLVEETGMPAHVMDHDLQCRLINAIMGCPNGTVRMADAMENTVETSNNLAIVQSTDDKIVIKTLMRSFVESAKEYLAECLRSVFELAGADVIKFEGGYPGWNPNPHSAILKLMQDTYKRLYGKSPRVMAIHAGLECGILGSKYTHWDMISFGPTIEHPHSPDERVNIASVGKFWNFLTEVLKEVPVK